MDVRFLLLGDSALCVEFGNDISVATNLKVCSFNMALKNRPIPGTVETVPTYRSLAVHYDPAVIRYAQLREELSARLNEIGKETGNVSSRVWDIPVWYGGTYGIDLEEVAHFHGKTPDEIIKIHTSYDNLVYMLGFTPGMAYTGAEESELAIPRKATPRVRVEESCVVIQQNQTIIIPITSPSGWNIIGRTPLKVFDANKDDPFLLKAGEWTRFYPIDENEYHSIKEQVDKGTYSCRYHQKEVLR